VKPKVVSAPSLLQGLNSSSTLPGQSMDCSSWPVFCDARLGCAAWPLQDAELSALEDRIATADGRANLRPWCMARRRYAGPLAKCLLEGDLQAYAREMFAAQRRETNRTNADLVETDAAYCFLAGHCNDTEVTPSTTLREAEAICNGKFGHESWTGIGWRDLKRVLTAARDMDDSSATEAGADVEALRRAQADVSRRASCAMGNYHCDVAYCRDNYCVDSDFRARYGSLAWAPAGL